MPIRGSRTRSAELTTKPSTLAPAVQVQVYGLHYALRHGGPLDRTSGRGSGLLGMLTNVSPNPG